MIGSLFSQVKTKTNQRDLINTPVIDIVPSTIILEMDTTQFVVVNVTVLNKGVGTLNLSGVNGSCYCSNGVIEKNAIRFLDRGTIRLEINKGGIQNGEDTVIFTVNSNARNSPYYITVKFIDSKKTNISNEK